MLKGISKIVSPELIKALCEMGHGDEIVIADGNFPAETFGKRVIRADGIGGAGLISTSDDSCKYNYLIPSEMYAVVTMKYLCEIARNVYACERRRFVYNGSGYKSRRRNEPLILYRQNKE